MPSGVFKPYAGVSTAALFFTRGAQTRNIWFYDMAHDGFSLDDKRVAIEENDIPDVVNCWEKRNDKKFKETRDLRIGELRAQLTPMKDERLKLHEEINRLTFELAIDSGSNGKSAADGKTPPP
ncbi:MAG: N-6 DNA methylase [Anaerolineales bacterium]